MRKANVKDTFIKTMIQDILAGTYQIGEKLPPERELSQSLGISRIAIHSGMVELGAKGLLRIIPRKGIYINDYIGHGGIEIIDILFTDSPRLDPAIFQSMMQARILLETEFSALAAQHRTTSQLTTLESIVNEERQPAGLEDTVKWDFAFHHEIARASGNVIYPMILKSMEATYENLVREFYALQPDRHRVLSDHENLVHAIRIQDSSQARSIMLNMIMYGNLVLDHQDLSGR